MYQVLIYRETRNLGDAIQAYAMARLLPPPLRGVYRSEARFATSQGCPFVVNGWLGDPVPDEPNSLFAGIFIGRRPEDQIRWIRMSRYRIGARDPETESLLRQAGIASTMIGCATLTLPRYDGPRRGVLSIDGADHSGSETAVPGPGARSMSNGTRGDIPWEEQWRLAARRLEQIRTAELVQTTRLHVALPCLAYGTPVIFPRSRLAKIYQRSRLSLLDALGLEYDRPFVRDVSDIAGQYVAFLERELQITVQPVETPQRPEPL